MYLRAPLPVKYRTPSYRRYLPWLFNLNKASHGTCELTSLYKFSEAIRDKRRFVFRGPFSNIFNFRPTLATQGMYHDPGHDIAGQRPPPRPPARSLPVDLIPPSRRCYITYDPIAHELCIPVIRRELYPKVGPSSGSSTP